MFCPLKQKVAVSLAIIFLISFITFLVLQHGYNTNFKKSNCEVLNCTIHDNSVMIIYHWPNDSCEKIGVMTGNFTKCPCVVLCGADMRDICDTLDFWENIRRDYLHPVYNIYYWIVIGSVLGFIGSLVAICWFLPKRYGEYIEM